MFLIFQVTLCEEKQTFLVSIYEYISLFEKWGHLFQSKEQDKKK